MGPVRLFLLKLRYRGSASISKPSYRTGDDDEEEEVEEEEEDY